MALDAGTADAKTGMSSLIYKVMNEQLGPSLDAAVAGADDAAKAAAAKAAQEARDGWKKLSYAIAWGVITHLVDQAEIGIVQVTGTVKLPVNAATSTATGTVTLAQSKPGTGLVK
jgi:acyl-homoserine lactone acylase PvdQ